MFEIQKFNPLAGWKGYKYFLKSRFYGTQPKFNWFFFTNFGDISPLNFSGTKYIMYDHLLWDDFLLKHLFNWNQIWLYNYLTSTIEWIGELVKSNDRNSFKWLTKIIKIYINFDAKFNILM